MALFMFEITQKKGYIWVLKAALCTVKTIENNLSSQQQNAQINCSIFIQENKNVAMKKNELGFGPRFHPLIAVWPQLNYFTSLSLPFLMSEKWRTSLLPGFIVWIRWDKVYERSSMDPVYKRQSINECVLVQLWWETFQVTSLRQSVFFLAPVLHWLWEPSCLLPCGKALGSHFPGVLAVASSACTSGWCCCHMPIAGMRLLLDSS